MNDKPERRWLAFSLRTMFVLVTAVCVWLGWTMSVIRQRRTVLDDLRASPGFAVYTVSQRIDEFGQSVFDYVPRPKIARVREWLGDEAIESISFPAVRGPDEYETRYLSRVFPEAKIERSDYAVIEVGPPLPP